MLCRRSFVGLLASLPATALAAPCCGVVGAQGTGLASFLDRSGVERLWLPGFKVEWNTGAAIHPFATIKGHTHCSAFVASIAMRLGVYLLRPPEHSPTLLANAQMAWLRTPVAVAQGWDTMADVQAAQARANAGALTVAVYENPDPHKPGHIAILRPSDIDAATLLAQGPFVTQAGGQNWISAPMEVGFRAHRKAWLPGGTGGAGFFAHSVEAGRLVG